jgi:hypothetical protein
MVAYSFAPQFHDQVSALQKLQTVRANRKRHARAGEPVQLYAGMRTRQCRKLVQTDPVCLDVRQIVIELGGPSLIKSIEIEGIPLDADEIEAFAVADGFGSTLADGHARLRMGLFWTEHHPLVATFDGVVIRWEPK